MAGELLAQQHRAIDARGACPPAVPGNFAPTVVRRTITGGESKCEIHCSDRFAIIRQAFNIATDHKNQPIFHVCLPPKNSRSQLIAVFVPYLDQNPQRRHEDAFVVTMDAYYAVFPCPSS